MGILPRKSEVVHVKLTLDQALEQLRLQYVRAAARIELVMTQDDGWCVQVQEHEGPRRARGLAHAGALFRHRVQVAGDI